MGKNLVLLGMMGVGKSALAKIVAKKCNLKLIDTDLQIEKKNAMAVNKIFRDKGENFFRKEEEEIVLNSLDENDSVIALGGGAFISEKIRKKVLSFSVSIWLDTKIDLLEKRLKNSKKRPLLNKNKTIIEELKKIYNDRKDIYSLANYKINCDNLSIERISEKIIEIYEAK